MVMAFPFPSDVPHEPSPELARRRERCPVSPVRLPTGDAAWLVTRYADNRVVLADARFSRAAAAARDAPRARLIPLDRRAITALDPPEHTRLRALVTPAFTARRIERLAPFMADLAGRLVDGLLRAGPPADLVALLARPLALGVIGHLLGLPEPDHGQLQKWTDAYLSVDAHTPEEMTAAVGELRALLGALVAARRKAPADDLVSVLCRPSGPDPLDDEEIISFGVTLLVAGYETMAAHLTSSVLVLLSHPDQLARLRREPGRWPGAVEELLRYTAISPSGGTIRIAMSDVELDGVVIRAGDAVLPSTISANRDPAVFADPDALDLGRRPGQHLAFGHGVHYCLGAGLARIELRLALEALLTRLPEFRLAVPMAELTWNRRKMIRGMATLPLAW
jgi:nocardicin N-oxygenase